MLATELATTSSQAANGRSYRHAAGYDGQWYKDPEQLRCAHPESVHHDEPSVYDGLMSARASRREFVTTLIELVAIAISARTG